jgi:hypothetical protein
MAKRKAAVAADAGAAVQQPGKQQRLDTAPDVAAAKQKRGFKNKEKVLVLGTRGITYRYVLKSRHDEDTITYALSQSSMLAYVNDLIVERIHDVTACAVSVAGHFVSEQNAGRLDMACYLEGIVIHM